ncbi:MAG: hypothetical protein N2745_12215 [Syntrophorhabdaceae bacterium]|nr:hypothetical protein [Syntrophorhabdaceae bacterium]
MREITVVEVEHTNIAILIVGSLVILIATRDFMSFFSFAVASAIVTINFRLLKKILENLIIKRIFEKKDVFIRLPLKFGLLMGAIAVFLLYGNVALVYFLIGLSTVFLSILICQLRPDFKTKSRKGI